MTLDDADNASEDPSDRWLKAFVPSRKEDPGEGSRDGIDKKQTPQPGEVEHRIIEHIMKWLM